jgi:uncharacterized glyoxalase superfamily protein PhnB
MLNNRSIPNAVIIPELGYADLGAAVAWLCAAFGFSERLRIGDHRAQLTLGPNAALVARATGGEASARVLDQQPSPAPADLDHSLLVRVADVDAHCAWARQHGARIVNPPTTYQFGERQYSALDIGGHAWTFSETVADVPPEAWGGVRAADAEPDPADDSADPDWSFEL